MFDSLSDRLRKTLANLTGRGRVSEADVDAAAREIRLALLEADVNFKVVKDVVGRIREKRAIGAEILGSLTAGQQIVKIVHDELVDLLSAGDRTFRLQGNPAVISLVGLQGSGKTTTAAKLARHIVKLGRRPLLVAADPYRPAAADQLETLGREPRHPGPPRPGGHLDRRHREGRARRRPGRLTRDTIILDTAGRLSLDEALMAEIDAVDDGGPPGRDAARRRCDDRPGGRRRRAGVRRRRAGDRPRPDQDRWRRPRRRGALDRHGHRASA